MPVVIEKEQLPVREARTGNPDAWNVLLARYRLPLYAYVFELVRDEQPSLDIVQEAFINAARHIASLRNDEKFGSWLFNIAHQKCVQHWRVQRPGGESVPVTVEDEQVANFDPGPRELLIRKEEEGQFMKTIEQLPGPHRAVLLLHFIEDFSLEDIARITETPVGTVKSRLYYARRAFRKLWEGA